MSDGNLRQLFRKNLPDIFFTAIETGSTGKGIPDDHYCCEGQMGWIEHKTTATNRVQLWPEQVAFHLRYARAGGRSFIAVRKKRLKSARLEACDELHIINGCDAKIVSTEGLGPSIGIFFNTNGPNQWNWLEIRRILLAK